MCDETADGSLNTAGGELPSCRTLGWMSILTAETALQQRALESRVRRLDVWACVRTLLFWLQLCICKESVTSIISPANLDISVEKNPKRPVPQSVRLQDSRRGTRRGRGEVAAHRCPLWVVSAELGDAQQPTALSEEGAHLVCFCPFFPIFFFRTHLLSSLVRDKTIGTCGCSQLGVLSLHGVWGLGGPTSRPSSRGGSGKDARMSERRFGLVTRLMVF